MYVKTKELGPLGGCAPEIFVCRSDTGNTKCLYLQQGGGDRLMFCAANMNFAEIFDDVFNFYVLIMICVININQITDHY